MTQERFDEIRVQLTAYANEFAKNDGAFIVGILSPISNAGDINTRKEITVAGMHHEIGYLGIVLDAKIKEVLMKGLISE